jgi:hypothetical protein
MQQVTFIIKNITDETHATLASMDDRARYEKLFKWAFGDLKHCVSVKYGSGQFRDRVDFNSWWKRGEPFKAYRIEPRKGYMLATFEY